MQIINDIPALNHLRRPLVAKSQTREVSVPLIEREEGKRNRNLQGSYFVGFLFSWVKVVCACPDIHVWGKIVQEELSNGEK